jgi:Zn-dependent protease/DNA-directed RNA polymerase subunit RPC12/RpoP
MPTRQGSIHLFRFAGVDVYLHWLWFLIAAYEIRGGVGTYSSIGWNIAEYLCLFLIVLVHEFGHALACRQVGGRADQIVLWPLGGVAYVDPPQRPGATLWSIAAGPLVNIALMPIFYALTHALGESGGSDISALLFALQRINLWLFIFNILPIYPLDGGQILRSLLWFVMGRARSLLVATILGFVGVAGFFVLAFMMRSIWSGALALFMLMNCWGGLQHARALLRIAKLPRRDGYACPTCKTSPPMGDYWKCGKCGHSFDTFQSGAVCPYCGTQYPVTRCLDCGHQHPMQEWAASALVPSNL